MRKAKYYIYRNLHTGTFSVRYKGKVIDHPTLIWGVNASFKVNAVGREKVILSKRKNVHAFIVVESYTEEHPIGFTKEVTYNPYTHKTFIPNKNVDGVLCINNKIYVKEIK